ncbi:DUF1822 family protein [Waterburya agarophytonicola K14]|uniref:DUF1822 family protein n=1 Tax=Waterburya agarophytonicola KI4 TaxID=2874699 RepID=A0A964BUD5_9CYAN|nr:DUF1822 family protein [Waterburya agarophytonicola]MCC0179349.1 DUF1822 family protein [Waterburya agarophytonicola KI4]
MTRSLATANPTITRGKTIQWQLNSLEREIILVLKMIQQSDKAIALCLQIYPGKINNNLPEGLSVSILDRTNQTCLSAQAKDSNDWMQLEFSCQPGEQFKIEMNLAGVSMLEQFIV